MLPRRMAVERIARPVEGDVVRQFYGQVLLRHRHDTALVAMDRRNRATPVTLARHQPVAQAVLRCAFADAHFFEAGDHLRLGFLDTEPVQEIGVDDHAIVDERRIGDAEALGIGVGRRHHGQDRQAVFGGELVVALVVAGAAEDGTGAVFHQHEIGGIDRHRLARHQRMAGEQRQLVAGLLRRLDLGRGGAGLAAFGDEALQARVAGRQFGGQRMLRRQRHERRAIERVGPCGEDFQPAAISARGVGEIPEHACAAALADPVRLHQAHLLRPALERVEAAQQLIREVRDLEVPLRELASLDRRTGAPALAVDHLLVGQHGVVDGIPVHPGFAAVGQARVPEIEEHLLLVAVVGGIAGREFAAPVERQAHRLELRLHGGDVLVGPLLRMDLLFHRGILGRQAEGVPAHGVQNVEAPGALVAGDHVALRVVAHVAHMDAPRRIGEHLEHVVLGPGAIHDGAERLAGVPDLLPPGFGFVEIVAPDGGGGRRRHGLVPTKNGSAKKTEAAADARYGLSRQVVGDARGSQRLTEKEVG